MALNSLVQSLGVGGYGDLWVVMEVMTMGTKLLFFNVVQFSFIIQQQQQQQE